MTSQSRSFVTKLIAVGEDVALVFPEELLEQWAVREGDEEHLVRLPNGFAIQRDEPPKT